MKDHWPRTDDGSYHIDDLVCPEFEEVLDSRDRTQLLNLARELDRRWKSNFHQIDCIPVRNGDGNQLTTTLSSFLIKLQTDTWLPCENSEQLFQPEALYLKTGDVSSVLDTFGHYFAGEVSEEKFINAIKLRTSVSLETVFEKLGEWCRDDVFCTSLDHMTNVYQFIKDRFHAVDRAELKAPLVFVPSKRHIKPDEKCRGKFYEQGKVCLYDFSGVISKHGELLQNKRILLSEFYPTDILEFFERDLEIDDSPPLCDYISMACALAENTKLPDGAAYDDLMKAFSKIGWKCISNEHKDNFKALVNTCEDFWDGYKELQEYIDKTNANFTYENVKDEEVLPTNRDKFVSVEEKPLLPDDQNLQNIYEREEAVHFIDLRFMKASMEKKATSIRRKGRGNHFKPKEEEYGVLAFFAVCKVKAISNVVLDEEVFPEVSVPGCEQWHNTLSVLLQYIQRYLYAKRKDIYDKLINENISEKLRNLKFFTAKSIETVHRIKDRKDVNVKIRKNCCIENVDGSIYLYIANGSVNEADDILTEVVKIFGVDNEGNAEELLDLLTSISNIESSPDRIEKTLKRKNIGKLPQSEEAWKLKEPKLLREISQTQTSKKTSLSDPNEVKIWPPPEQESLRFPPCNRTEKGNALPPEWIEPASPESPRDTTKLQATETKSLNEKSHKTQTAVKKDQGESTMDEASNKSLTSHGNVDIGPNAAKEESKSSLEPPPKVTDAEDNTPRDTRLAKDHQHNSVPNKTGDMNVSHGNIVFTLENQKQAVLYEEHLVPFGSISKEVEVSPIYDPFTGEEDEDHGSGPTLSLLKRTLIQSHRVCEIGWPVSFLATFITPVFPSDPNSLLGGQ